MADVKPRVKVDKNVKAGEPTTIKTLISHTMESGQRKDDNGNPIPRNIINKFTATFNGEEVISVNMEPAISANPFFEFTAAFPDSGTLHLEWVDDDGTVYKLDEEITVG
jgi:sulfur-oxidizing protein SoxZ